MCKQLLKSFIKNPIRQENCNLCVSIFRQRKFMFVQIMILRGMVRPQRGIEFLHRNTTKHRYNLFLFKNQFARKFVTCVTASSGSLYSSCLNYDSRGHNWEGCRIFTKEYTEKKVFKTLLIKTHLAKKSVTYVKASSGGVDSYRFIFM